MRALVIVVASPTIDQGGSGHSGLVNTAGSTMVIAASAVGRSGQAGVESSSPTRRPSSVAVQQKDVFRTIQFVHVGPSALKTERRGQSERGRVVGADGHHEPGDTVLIGGPPHQRQRGFAGKALSSIPRRDGEAELRAARRPRLEIVRPQGRRGNRCDQPSSDCLATRWRGAARVAGADRSRSAGAEA